MSDSSVSSSSSSGLSQDAATRELRDAFEGSALHTEDGKVVGTDYGVDVTVQGGMDNLTDKLAERLEDGIQRGVSLRGMEAEPMSAEGKEVVNDFARGMAEGLHDHSRADRTAEAASALGELTGTLQMAETVEKAALAAQGFSETDASANLAVLTQLNELKSTELVVPAGASSEFVQAAEAVNNLTDKFPDPAAAALANEHFSVPASGIGRSIGAALLDRAADQLVDAYGDKANAVSDKIHDLTAVIRSGGDDKEVFEAYGKARKELDGLIKELARGASEAVANDEAVSPALDKLSEQSQKTYDRWEQAAVGKDGELSGDSMAQLAHSAQQLEAAGADELAKAAGPAGPAVDGVDAPEGPSPGRSPVDNLREVLGDAANGLSDAQLTQAMGEGFAERAQELNVTKADVDAALDELKSEAVREGRDPATVDEAVAVAALVERENVLERGDVEKGPSELASEASHEASSLDNGAERAGSEAAETQAAEHVAEMEMGV